MTTKIPFKE